jgi:diadenosine tetraphosphate (Ap4A) HIT family hydrolase
MYKKNEIVGLEKDSSIVCHVPSGWVELCTMQYLRGYSILRADPIVGSLNALNREKQSRYLCDMALIGEALLEVTGAYRINYAIMGNSNPVLHAHIVPRYVEEPAERREGHPWSYSQEIMNSNLFNYERDKALIKQLAAAIQKRLE